MITESTNIKKGNDWLPQERRKVKTKFIAVSLVGIALFLFPIRSGGRLTILISIIADFLGLNCHLEEYMPYFCLVVFAVSAISSLYVKLAKPAWIEDKPFLKTVLVTNWGWLTVRILAMIFAVMILFHIGPEFIIGDNTGHTIMWGIVPRSTVMLFVCAFALPLLLEFGLLEFVGVLVHKPFRKIFNLPGRAAIDCLSSWLGDSTMGILLTDAQYKAGGYTHREASVIMACFSAATISSSLSFLALVDMSNMFVPFYLIICIMGVICALILPHVPPLSRKKDTLYPGAVAHKNDEEDLPQGYTRFQWAVECGMQRARSSYSLKSFFTDGAKTCVSILFKVSPSLLTIGTIALIISEYTPIFDYLGIVFYPFFKLVGLPDAMEAASTLMASFADNFIPCIIASTTVGSQLTQFVIVLIAYNSLIYMTGPGSVMVQTETGLGLGELFVIFLERVVLSIILGGILARVLFTFIM